MTDVIGTADPDAPSRPRRHVPRWLTWAAIAAVAAVGIVVPAARTKLADRAASWLRNEWTRSTSYDDARFAAIVAVANRAGALDGAIIDQATRLTDRQDADALQRIADAMASHWMWSSEGDHARDAAVAAVRNEVHALRLDAQAAHPSTGYLFVPGRDNLVSGATARINALARHRSLGKPRTAPAVTLPPDANALARLRQVTDFPTGLSLVLSGPGQPQIVDLDTGRRTTLRIPAIESDVESWAGRIIVITGHGAQVFDVHGRPGVRFTRKPAQLLSHTGSSLWLARPRGVRRYDAAGHATTRWIPLPADRAAASATDDTVILVHVVDESRLVGERWNPMTGARHQLPASCFGGWATAARTVVALPCGGDREISSIDAVTGAVHRIHLPRPADESSVETFNPLSPTGRQFAVGLTDQGLRPGLVDLRTGQFQRVPGDGTLTVAAWSPDGQWALVADEGSFGNGRRPQMALWHPSDGRTTSIRLSPGDSLLGGMQLLETAGG